MNQLIKIEHADDGKQTVNARELHQFLEVGKDFSSWIKDRIEAYGFAEGQDYLFTKIGEQLASGTKYKNEYFVSLDMAKELAMVERNAKGKQARQYFIECERQAKEGGSLSLSSNIPQKHKNMRSYLSVAKLIGLKGNQAILSANQLAKKVDGIDWLNLLGATHLIAEKQIRHLTPTELGEKVGLSAQKFNSELEKAGFQISSRNTKGHLIWAPTEKGKEFAVLLDTAKKHSDGTPVQQVKWLENVLEELTSLETADEKTRGH